MTSAVSLVHSDRPWTALRPDLADVLRPVLPDVARTALQEIARQLPGLGGDLSGRSGAALRSGIGEALEQFLTLLGTAEPALDPELTALYASFGARESRRGRPLDALLAAYRIGARVSWARFSAAAVAAGVGVDELVVLAESIFVYIDELSGASASGHARDHAARTGFRDVLRSQLAEALIEGGAASDATRVQRLADEVAWPIPARMAVAVLPLPATGSGPPRRLPIAPPDVLVLGRQDEILVVLPDPSGPGRRTRLESVVGPNDEVYVGTVRTAQEAPRSLAHARAVQRLVQDGVLRRAPVVAAADHLPELVLHADPGLLAELTRRVLAPLDGVSPRRRDELAATLRAWLAQQGDRRAVADQLAVHPQTVSYRMAQLATLFGDTLRSPAGRLALTVALESRGACDDVPAEAWLSRRRRRAGQD